MKYQGKKDVFVKRKQLGLKLKQMYCAGWKALSIKLATTVQVRVNIRHTAMGHNKQLQPGNIVTLSKQSSLVRS